MIAREIDFICSSCFSYCIMLTRDKDTDARILTKGTKCADCEAQMALDLYILPDDTDKLIYGAEEE